MKLIQIIIRGGGSHSIDHLKLLNVKGIMNYQKKSSICGYKGGGIHGAGKH